MDQFEWISVLNKTPKDFTFVLATINSGDDKWVEIVGYNCGSFELPARGNTSYVTHWMEIPKPA